MLLTRLNKRSLSKMNDDENKTVVPLADYTDEFQAIKEEIGEIENLYQELKTHFDLVKRNTAKSPNGLEFVHRQTGNLVTLKKTKVDMLKELVSIKSKGFNENIKVKTSFKEDGSKVSDETVHKVADSILEKIGKRSYTTYEAIEISPEDNLEMDNLILANIDPAKAKKIINNHSKVDSISLESNQVPLEMYQENSIDLNNDYFELEYSVSTKVMYLVDIEGNRTDIEDHPNFPEIEDQFTVDGDDIYFGKSLVKKIA